MAPGGVYGIILPLRLARERSTAGQKVAIFTDDNDIVNSLPKGEKSGPQESSHPKREIRSMVLSVHDLRQEGIDVSVHCVRGHRGRQNAASGNTLAHQTANEARKETAAIAEDAKQALALRPGRKRKKTQ